VSFPQVDGVFGLSRRGLSMGGRKGKGVKESPQAAAIPPPGREALVVPAHSSLANFLADEYESARPSQDLVPDQPGFIIAIPDFLSREECAALIAGGEHLGLSPPSASDLQPRKGEAFLNRDTLRFHDSYLSLKLWQRLQPHLPSLGVDRVPLGLHSDGSRGRPGELRLYRYMQGQCFGLHVDQSWKGQHKGSETEYTFLLYLNSAGEGLAGLEERPLAGGDTVFMATAKRELCRVTPRAGFALLHAHGRRCLMHESTNIEKGRKYLLRADVLYGPPEAQGSAGT